ncbi:MAG: DedA family protein [Paracoccaceae bacterium]
MTDTILSAVPTYGPWLVALITFLSCLAVPVPASILMLAAGGFAAAGDLDLWQVAGGALLGAVGGDQTGYWAARKGGAGLLDRVATGTKAHLVARARAFIAAKGALAVFLSRWLVSPLGPYANLVTGATRFDWLSFTIAGALGEAVWVAVYVGAGYSFGDNLEAATEFAGSILGFMAAGAVAAGLGWWLWTLAKRGE